MATVVTARKSAWSRVTETEELIGVFMTASALPQYLIQAMFVGAETVTMTMGLSLTISLSELLLLLLLLNDMIQQQTNCITRLVSNESQ